MADVNLQIRVDEELKDLFNKLADESGLKNREEFTERLITLYLSEQAKEQAPLLKPAIESVETLTARLLEVLNGAAATIVTKEEGQQKKLDEQQKSFDETRALLQQRITFLEEAQSENEQHMQTVKDAAQRADQQAEGLRVRIGELEKALQDKQALIDTLTPIVNENKGAVEDNRRLQSDNDDLMRKIQNAEMQISTLKDETARLTEQHSKDLDRQKDTLNLEHENALLNVKSLHQDKLQELREAMLKAESAHQDALRALQDKHSQKIEDYEAKIFNLIDEKTAQKTTPTPKKPSTPRGKKPIAATAEPTETEA